MPLPAFGCATVLATIALLAGCGSGSDAAKVKPVARSTSVTIADVCAEHAPGLTRARAAWQDALDDAHFADVVQRQRRMLTDARTAKQSRRQAEIVGMLEQGAEGDTDTDSMVVVSESTAGVVESCNDELREELGPLAP